MSSALKRTRMSPTARAEQLLDVAADMIESNGLGPFTMDGLARQAQVSAPLVYNYFPSRLELLRSLLKREYLRFAHDTFTKAEQAEDFEAIVRIAVRSNFAHYARGSVLTQLMAQREVVSVIAESQKQHSRASANFLIDKAAEYYSLSEHEARLAVTMSSGAAMAAASQSSNQQEGVDQTIDLVVDYILAGIERITKQTQTE